MTPLEIVKKYNKVCWHGKQPDLAADILAEAPDHRGKAQAEAGECGMDVCMNPKRGFKMDGARHVRGSSHS